MATFYGFGLKKQDFKFSTDREPVRFIENLRATILRLLPDEKTRSSVKMAVIAYPGIVQNGQPVSAPNLTSWNGYDLIGSIKDLFTSNGINCPFYFENDANLGAFYECRNMKGKNVYLTFSTGIGGGIMQDGKLSPESTTFEPGRMVFTYNGQQATWEQFASVAAINAAYEVDDIKKLADNKRALFDIAARVSLGVSQITREQNPAHIVIGGPLGLVWPGISAQLKAIMAPSQNPLSVTKVVSAKKPMECVEYGCYHFAKATEKALKG